MTKTATVGGAIDGRTTVGRVPSVAKPALETARIAGKAIVVKATAEATSAGSR